MQLTFCVNHTQSAVKNKVRMILGDLYGSIVKEVDHQNHLETTFYPLTGIYGIRDNFGLDAMKLRVCYVDTRTTAVRLSVPEFSRKTELYNVMSPIAVAWNFDLINRELRIGMHKYIIDN